MVYYVRFLKTPRIDHKNGSVSISALICITTDLGDSFLAEDVDLMISAHDEASHMLCEKQVKWNAYNRELPITLGSLPTSSAKKALILTVKPPQPKSQSRLDHTSIPPRVPLVIGASSASFGPQSTPAEKLVLRHIGDLPQAPMLDIWEETGNSIARHIWDAGLATAMYLSDTIHYLRSEEQGRKSKERWTPNKELYFVSQIPALRKLLSTVHNPPLQVVELGAGCGIVGIGLATMLANCSVLLTDLPEVEEIITRNIKANNTQDMSSLKYRNLDWENPPDDLCSWPIELILVSDCTYNADSLPVLVSALDRLVRTSPGAIILVALKRRHDSETVFFDLMRSAGFTSEQETVEVPSQHEEVDEIEFHCYRRS